MSQQTINGYDVKHLRGTLTISKDGGLVQFTAGEVDQIRHLINIALGMQQLPALPPQIKNGRFEVAFNESDTLSLSTNDGEGVLTFGWNDGDELILTLDAASAIALNELRMKTVL